ncbi:hypothetical protein OUZ56_003716 [Daphnia magna]|uniref:Uncharacterized protein n=1 Tax=Daphnia magna TaxID=35525 RepID=A0ABR0A9K6_9CRUS|nr:hypothetical protein OUZ56_003716 [Daphnia magna]
MEKSRKTRENRGNLGISSGIAEFTRESHKRVTSNTCLDFLRKATLNKDISTSIHRYKPVVQLFKINDNISLKTSKLEVKVNIFG